MRSTSRRSVTWAQLVFCLGVLSPPAADATLLRLHRDTRTDSTLPNSNFGTSGTLRVDDTERTWLRFASGALPTGTSSAHVVKATLRLYPDSVSGSGTLDLHRVAVAWNEGTLTHANAPSPAGSVALGIAVSVRQFVDIDVTQFVKDSLDGLVPNEGFVLARSPGSTLTAVFDSKEDTATSHEALLEVTLAPELPALSGAIILWDQAGGCPPGTTLVTAFDGLFPRGSTTAGTSGGSANHVHDGGSLSGAGGLTGYSTGSLTRIDDNSGGSDFDVPFEHLGGTRLDHRHSFSGIAMSGSTGATDHLPPFRTVLFCRID